MKENEESHAQVVAAVNLLESVKKLERDKGLKMLENELHGLPAEQLDWLMETLLHMIRGKSWQSRYGGLAGCKMLLSYCGQQWRVPEDFQNALLQQSLELLDDSEARVRLAAGEVLGGLCRAEGGTEIYHQHIEQPLQEKIRSTLKRDARLLVQEVLVLRKKIGGRTYIRDDNGDPGGDSSDGEDLCGEPLAVGGVDHLFHDTAGWKSLETNFRCLLQIMYGCGSSFEPMLTHDMLHLVYTGVKHKNRFVRGTGFEICGLVIDCCKSHDKLLQILDRLNLSLATGLADNWSTVRMAASVATRKLLCRLTSEERERLYPVLLPRMCLNRYLVAEGVRSYSQQTWELVMGNDGRRLVGQYIGQTVAFYDEQSDADNHAVREAACMCLAEVVVKVDPVLVTPYLSDIFTTLYRCSKDGSWPVRARGCVSIGRLIRHFPEAFTDQADNILTLIGQTLQDPIWSVREDAAMAVGDILVGWKDGALEYFLPVLTNGLQAVHNQPKDPKPRASLTSAETEDQPMVSCDEDTVASRPGDKIDHTYHRPAAPWEVSDGCVYLLREIAVTHPKTAVSFLPALADLTSLRHYEQHTALLHTVWRCLPEIAKSVGKRGFKQHLELFLDSIAYSLHCHNEIAANSAAECVRQLSSFIGRSIFIGRLEAADPKYVELILECPLVSTERKDNSSQWQA